MISPNRARSAVQPPRGRRARSISLSAVRRWAQQIASRFDPERIILFGSYARGRQCADSDVDILVVMPAANEITQAIRLTLAFDPPFALDLIVRTPEHLRRGLKDGDSFLREVIGEGRLLYEHAHDAMDSQGRGRRPRRRRAGAG
jgi:predicted nucleotidyltransferase